MSHGGSLKGSLKKKERRRIDKETLQRGQKFTRELCFNRLVDKKKRWTLTNDR